MSEPIMIGPARLAELGAAITLFFQHLPVPDRDRRVRSALELVQSGEFDPAGVFLARSDGTLLGVQLCQLTPGASALVWPPRTTAGPPAPALAEALVTHACHWLQQRGAKLAHALLNEQEMQQAAPLLRQGFQQLARLWYLRHPLEELPAFAPALDYIPFPATDPVLFQRTLLQTYEGTLDCPELNGVRTAEEILAGHRAQGVHDPARWWLARAAGNPVGVLLLTDMPAQGGWELSYLGIVSTARRRGYGRALTCQALHEARRAGAPQLTLSVDERNVPAWELYTGLGFVPFDRREVLVALFR